MRPLKNGILALAAVGLFGIAVFLIWCLLFYMPGMFAEPDGTLVWRSIGKLVSL